MGPCTSEVGRVLVAACNTELVAWSLKADPVLVPPNSWHCYAICSGYGGLANILLLSFVSSRLFFFPDVVGIPISDSLVKFALLSVLLNHNRKSASLPFTSAAASVCEHILYEANIGQRLSHMNCPVNSFGTDTRCGISTTCCHHM